MYLIWLIIIIISIVEINCQCPNLECLDCVFHNNKCHLNLTNRSFEVNIKYNKNNETKDLEIKCKEVNQLKLFITYFQYSIDSINGIENLKFYDCNIDHGKEFNKIIKKIIGEATVRILKFYSGNIQNFIESSELNVFPYIETLRFYKNNLTNAHVTLFHQLKALKKLSLHNTNLSDLKDGFLKVSGLKDLEVIGNRIHRIKNYSFKYLRNLETLNLSHNSIYFIERNSFDHLTSLLTINLTNNNLIKLPEFLFFTLLSLQTLIIVNNPIKTLPHNLFCDGQKSNDSEMLCKGRLYSVKYVDINSNQLRFLTAGVFDPLTNMEHFDASNNKMQLLYRFNFYGNAKLKKLNLSNNGLSLIDFTFLNNTKLLEVLDLSYNKITNIEKEHIDQFVKAQNLKEIYLSNNEIIQIDPQINYPTSLELLDLSQNKIDKISIKSMEFLEKLVVDLTYNSITKVETYNKTILNENTSRIISICNQMTILLSNNPIECSCAIYNLLEYNENQLNIIPKTGMYLDLNELTCTNSGDLDHEPITSIKSENFNCRDRDVIFCPRVCECWARPHDQLYIVDCSRRELKDSPRSIEYHSNYEISVNLSYNHLTEIPLMINQSMITVLLLSYNQIKHVELNRLIQFRNLKELDLSNNYLTRLDSNLLQFLSLNVKRLNLINNPWICDCDAVDLYNFIGRMNLNIINLQQTTCHQSNKLIFQMAVNDFCPKKFNLLLGLSIAVALSGIIIGAILATYYRYHHEIKVWLYAHKVFLSFITEEEIDKDKLYDAFISFAHKDVDFVVNNLMLKLEEEPDSFKLCVHFRDWLAGDWIPDQISRSVENSRRTIVVLSPNFLESIWGKMEFRVAHNQALMDGAARVIIILYGDIELADITDPELKAYLNMNTYIKWGDPWFWKKLKYALPHSKDRIFKSKKIKRKLMEHSLNDLLPSYTLLLPK